MTIGRQIDRTLNKLTAVLQRTRLRRDIGRLVVRTIFQRTKRGFGVSDSTSDNPRQRRLKRLSPGYVEQRRKRRTGTGSFFSPGRSNLTNTEQMLDAIDFRLTPRGVRVFIKPSARRDSRLNNQEVANFVQNERPFFALTTGEQRIINRRIELELIRAARGL